MKKILLYIAVAIIVVSCGVSIYYVVRNDENIYETTAQSKNIYLNMDETVEIPVKHDRPNENTTLQVECDSDSVEIDTENWTITAKEAGVAKIDITSSNTKFGPFQFIFTVGNGSVNFPYYIRNAEDMIKIGSVWGLSENYELVNDIDMKGVEIEPIGSMDTPFNGNFNGSSENYTITNLAIDKSQDSTREVGLFGTIGEKGKVENLKISNATVISRSKFTGIIAGRNYGLIGKCIIENSSINTNGTGKVYSGLVCGLNESKNSEARVSLCTINGEIYSSYTAGGVVGYNKAGVIDNNMITLTQVESIGIDSEALFGGVAGYTRDGSSDVKYSIVENNLVSIENLIQKQSTVGGIFGSTAATKETRGIYSMLVYNSTMLLTPVGKNNGDVVLSSDSDSAINYAVNTTKTEIVTKSTYSKGGSTWDFNNIWKLKRDENIALDYENEKFDYTELPIAGDIIEILDKSTLIAAINNMRANPSAKITYKIMGESTIEEEKDENNEVIGENVIEKTYTYAVNGEWTPIGTKDNPFAGRIIADKDATITINKADVKFISAGEYGGTISGLFGYLSNDAYISNVIAQGCTYTGSMVGGIAGYANGAKIVNCTVKNSTLTTTKYAGGIAGYGFGIIEDCSTEMNKIYVTNDEERNIYLGGIVGKTSGNIINGEVDTLETIISLEGKNNTVCFGGIVGHISNASINSSKVLALSATGNRYLGRMYAGGIAGYSVKSKIEKCGVSESQQVILNTENVSSIAGGLIGFMSEGSLSQSAVGGITLKSYASAGLVSFCMGEVSECYVGYNVFLEGNIVGGLTCNLYSLVKNSYAICFLKGNNVSAGFTTYLWKNAEIRNCYTYCSYGEAGEAYADTYSNYKGNKNAFGEIKDSIIVGCEDQKFAKPSLTDWYMSYMISKDGQKKVRIQVEFFIIKGTFNYISENALIGRADFYKTFKDLGFDTSIWRFDEGETLGNSPILRDVYDLGESAANVISDVGEEENTTNEDTIQEGVGEENTTNEETVSTGEAA